MFASPWKTAPNPSEAASSSSADPASVTARKRAAARGPTRARRRSRKYRRKRFVSSVVPDLLETMNSAPSGSTAASNVRTCAGSVESSTCRPSPARRPNTRCSSSGKRLDPPIPSSAAPRRSSRWTCADSRARRVDSAPPGDGGSSQPSHCPSPLPVQTEPSRCHSRPRRPEEVQSSAAPAVSSASAGGRSIRMGRSSIAVMGCLDGDRLPDRGNRARRQGRQESRLPPRGRECPP